MRIKFTFKAEKLPIIYRHRFMALIKEALSIADKTYKDKLYSSRLERPKPFVFSVCLPSFNYSQFPTETFDLTASENSNPPSVTEKVIPIPPSGRVSLLISSYDFEFMTHLYNGLLEMKNQGRSFSFNNNITLQFDRAFVLNEKKIKSNEVVFKTLSPVLIEKQEIEDGRKKDKPILPEDNEFNEIFNNIHKGILKDIKGHDWVEQRFQKPLEFSPEKIKKSVVKHTIRHYWEKNPDNPVMKFTCFEGCFKLTGHPEVLQMLYQIGIGLRTGQGFGMVETV